MAERRQPLDVFKTPVADSGLVEVESGEPIELGEVDHAGVGDLSLTQPETFEILEAADGGQGLVTRCRTGEVQLGQTGKCFQADDTVVGHVRSGQREHLQALDRHDVTQPGVSQRLLPSAEAGDRSAGCGADLADGLEGFGDVAPGPRHRIDQRIGRMQQSALGQLAGEVGSGGRGEQRAREIQRFELLEVLELFAGGVVDSGMTEVECAE